MCDSLKLHINDTIFSACGHLNWAAADSASVFTGIRWHHYTNLDYEPSRHVKLQSETFEKIAKMLYCTPDRLSMQLRFYCYFYYWIIHVHFVQILPMYFLILSVFKVTYKVTDFSGVCVNFTARLQGFNIARWWNARVSCCTGPHGTQTYCLEYTLAVIQPDNFPSLFSISHSGSHTWALRFSLIF